MQLGFVPYGRCACTIWAIAIDVLQGSCSSNLEPTVNVEPAEFEAQCYDTNESKSLAG
jgi:hypothetical protein